MDEAILNNLDQAMRDDDLATVATLLDEHPDLISTPVRSRNWGPPLSHAANLGKLNIVAALLHRNPADVEHAFGRACLQGQLAVARYLLAQRPALGEGLESALFGPCEALKPAEGDAAADGAAVARIDVSDVGDATTTRWAVAEPGGGLAVRVEVAVLRGAAAEWQLAREGSRSE